MTADEAIGFARLRLSQEDAFASSEATYVGNVSSEWLVTFEKVDGSKVHFNVHSNGTTSIPGLVIQAYPPRYDRGWGWRFTLPLIGYTGLFIAALILVYRVVFCHK